MDKQIDSWNVMVNGVTVGKIESAVLTKIDQNVMRDKRIWLAQGIELGCCVVRGLSCLNSTHKCNAHPCMHFVRRLPAQALARA